MSRLKFLIPIIAALALAAAVACTSAPASQPGDDTVSITNSDNLTDRQSDDEPGAERVEAPIHEVMLRLY
jgi:hypothetical protein